MGTMGHVNGLEPADQISGSGVRIGEVLVEDAGDVDTDEIDARPWHKRPTSPSVGVGKRLAVPVERCVRRTSMQAKRMFEQGDGHLAHRRVTHSILLFMARIMPLRRITDHQDSRMGSRHHADSPLRTVSSRPEGAHLQLQPLVEPQPSQM